MNNISFIDLLDKYQWNDIVDLIDRVSLPAVDKVLQKNSFNFSDLAVLISRAAGKRLSLIKEKARLLTTQYFGKARLLYAPLYVTNFCVNQCLYCSFSRDNNIKRKRLSYDEIISNAEFL